MTLKQQFLDMLPLILPSISDGEAEVVNDETYIVKENESVKICDFKHEVSTLDIGVDCYECIHNSNTNCKHRRPVKVDVIIENYCEDFHRYYCFGKKPIKENLEYITYINTRKQLFDALADLKFEVEHWKNFCYEQYEKQEALREYAQEFFEDIKARLNLPIDTEILPIIFYSDNCPGQLCATEKVTVGRLHTYNKQSNINLYFCEDRDVEEIKPTIRHEIIHYYLWACNLKYDDDTAVFHALCELFDGGAYMPMTSREQRLFNRYKRIVKFYNEYEPSDNSNALKDLINANQIHLALELGSTRKNKPYNGCLKILEDAMKDRIATDKFLEKVATGNATHEDIESFRASQKAEG